MASVSAAVDKGWTIRPVMRQPVRLPIARNDHGNAYVLAACPAAMPGDGVVQGASDEFRDGLTVEHGEAGDPAPAVFIDANGNDASGAACCGPARSALD